MRRTIVALIVLSFALCAAASVEALRLSTASGGAVAAPTRGGSLVSATPAAPAADTVQAASLLAKKRPAVQAPAAAPGTTLLVSPKSIMAALFDAPYGHVVGALSTTTWGGPTVRPVVQTQKGWLQIRLDSRPNGSTAWVAQSDVNLSSTNYRIAISVSQRSVTLYQAGRAIYSAPVGVGQPQWPTPVGPSFVDAVYPVPASETYIYGSVVLITASHSNVFTEFDGGDGTVAIHAYPSDPASTQGVMSSHGCVRVSEQTIETLTRVVPGTPIDITP